MKKITSLILAVLLTVTFSIFALGSSESETTTTDQGTGTVEKIDNNTNLGDYKVEIVSCRLAPATGFQEKDVVIVKYKFTNNSDDAQAFYLTFEDTVYQDGIGLNECYFVDDSANYDSGNQTKEIKTGATLEVEVAYELNDSTTDIDVEVKELISFNDSVVKKTFSIS